MIYLIKGYGGNGDNCYPLLKIGYTGNLNTRFKDYLTHCPDCDILGVREGDRELENFLHKYFEKYKYKSEWFYYDDEIIDEFYNINLPVKNLNGENENDIYNEDLINFLRNYIKESVIIHPYQLFFKFKEELSIKYNITFLNNNFESKALICALNYIYDDELETLQYFDFTKLLSKVSKGCGILKFVLNNYYKETEKYRYLIDKFLYKQYNLSKSLVHSIEDSRKDNKINTSFLIDGARDVPFNYVTENGDFYDNLKNSIEEAVKQQRLLYRKNFLGFSDIDDKTTLNHLHNYFSLTSDFERLKYLCTSATLTDLELDSIFIRENKGENFKIKEYYVKGSKELMRNCFSNLNNVELDIDDIKLINDLVERKNRIIKFYENFSSVGFLRNVFISDSTLYYCNVEENPLKILNKLFSIEEVNKYYYKLIDSRKDSILCELDKMINNREELNIDNVPTIREIDILEKFFPKDSSDDVIICILVYGTDIESKKEIKKVISLNDVENPINIIKNYFESLNLPIEKFSLHISFSRSFGESIHILAENL